MNLIDIKRSLTMSSKTLGELPLHFLAFSAYMVPDYQPELEKRIDDLEKHNTYYGYVAFLGFILAIGQPSKNIEEKFYEEINNLSGRTFFSPSKVPRFEIDSVALLGVAIGIASSGTDEKDIDWLINLLIKAKQALSGDVLEENIIQAALVVLSKAELSSISDPLVHVAISNALKLNPCIDSIDQQAAWKSASSVMDEENYVVLAIKRTVFDYFSSVLTSLPINGANVEELVKLLKNISRSMSHWTYEINTRVKKSPIRKWDIDHEYHVQNLLWTILKPIFSDLVDEESLPKIGHMTPRYDLGIPSLRTIIEVKFMRSAGQRACRKITEEIAADSAIYLSPKTDYQKIIAFIWDDCAQTEEYQVLEGGIKELKGVEDVIILPRPNRMKKETIT